MNYKSTFFLLSQIYKGATLYRALTNQLMKNIVIKGIGIDLGAKSKNASYYKYINHHEAIIQFADLIPKSPEILQLDLENDFNIDDESQDFILLMNVMEHIYNYQNCISECHRILKTSSVLYGVIPFIHKYHADPEDYHRLTHSALLKAFSSAGFSSIEIVPIGFGQFSAAFSQLYTSIFRLGILRMVGAFFVIIIDSFFNVVFKKFKNKTLSHTDYALGYFFKVIK
jgi:hypothetical protein